MTGASAASSAAFWENEQIFDNTDWLYKTLPPCTAVGQNGCMTDIGPAPGSDLQHPGHAQ